MKNIKVKITVALIALALLAVPLAALSSTSVSAAAWEETPKAKLCEGSGGKPHSDGTCTYSGKGTTSVDTLIENVVNILLFIIGAAAVIMIIIGGIRYTTSNGDQAQITSAKNTILYAVIGIVVALMAYAIVQFVLRSL